MSAVAQKSSVPLLACLVLGGGTPLALWWVEASGSVLSLAVRWILVMALLISTVAFAAQSWGDWGRLAKGALILIAVGVASSWSRAAGTAHAERAALERHPALKRLTEIAVAQSGTAKEFHVSVPFSDMRAGTAIRSDGPGSWVVDFRYVETRRGLVLVVGGAKQPPVREGNRCFKRLRDDLYMYRAC